MLNNNDIIETVNEAELINKIDKFLMFFNEYETNINNKERKKILKKIISRLETDIYISEYQLGETCEKIKIQELEIRIEADKQVIKEIRKCIGLLPCSKTKIFRRKIRTR